MRSVTHVNIFFYQETGNFITEKSFFPVNLQYFEFYRIDTGGKENALPLTSQTSKDQNRSQHKIEVERNQEKTEGREKKRKNSSMSFLSFFANFIIFTNNISFSSPVYLLLMIIFIC